MSTRAERKARANRRRCINCGEFGPHYVPPSMGDRGFFHCTPQNGPETAPGATNSTSHDSQGGDDETRRA